MEKHGKPSWGPGRMIYATHYILKPEDIRSIVRDHLSRFGVDEEVADRLGWIMSYRGYDPESLTFWLTELGYNEIHARILSLLVTERLVAEASRRAVLYQAFHSVVMTQPVLPPAEKMRSVGVSDHPPTTSRNSEIGSSTSMESDLASRVLKEIKILKKKVLTYEKRAREREARKAFQEIVAMLREEHVATMNLLKSRLQQPGPCEGYKDPYYEWLCVTTRSALEFVRERRLRSAIKDLAKIVQILTEEELYG